MNIASLIEAKPNPNIPELAPGDTVKVSAKIVEAGKERTQPFQGVVIKLRRGGIGSSFTVRRIAYGVGVERTFPLYSPIVEKVEVIRHGKVRRARLYYLRERSGKSARIKERRVDEKKKPKKAQAVQAQDELELVEAQAEQEPVEAQIEQEPVEAQEEQELVEAQAEQEPVEAQAEQEPVEAQAEQEPDEAQDKQE